LLLSSSCGRLRCGKISMPYWFQSSCLFVRAGARVLGGHEPFCLYVDVVDGSVEDKNFWCCM
jgi:hypothetical protein